MPMAWENELFIWVLEALKNVDIPGSQENTFTRIQEGLVLVRAGTFFVELWEAQSQRLCHVFVASGGNDTPHCLPDT